MLIKSKIYRLFCRWTGHKNFHFSHL